MSLEIGVVWDMRGCELEVRLGISPFGMSHGGRSVNDFYAQLNGVLNCRTAREAINLYVSPTK
jgi:hypothetical protein